MGTQMKLTRIFFVWWFSCFATSLFAENFNIYFGDLHQHSAFSWDARSSAKTPALAYAYAKNVAKIDFMALTDHTNGLSESNYQVVRFAASVYDNPDSQFVAIAGQELGSLGSSGYGHMNIFESLTRADNASDTDTRFNLANAYQFLIDNNLLGQFNHPTTDNGNSNFNNLAYFQPVDLHISSMELVNGKRSDDYEEFYLLALRNGWHVGAVGDQDNHGAFYGNSVSNSGDIYLTGVLADSLTKPKILDAIRNHRTYAFQTSPATDRMYLTEFTADGHWMGEEFDNDDSVLDFRIAAHAEGKFISAQLYRNNVLIAYFEPESNDFQWQFSDSASFGRAYYFLKLVQEDTDVLWSSPIWVHSPGQNTDPASKRVEIADLRTNFENGLPRSLGWTNITVRGVATAGREFGDSGPGYLQDATGGIAIFGTRFTEKVIPGVALEFEVTGVVSFFNGQTELIPYAVQRKGVAQSPVPRQVSTNEIAQNGEFLEGLLVTVVGARINGRFPGAGASANLSIDDGSGSCTLRIDSDTDIPGNVTPSGAVNITGIVGQFDTSAPYTQGYQLLPRRLADITVATSVVEEKGGPDPVPAGFRLYQNYPNPFNAGTVITFSLPVASEVRLEIYSIRGQLVATLVNQRMSAGTHRIVWNGMPYRSGMPASGVYIAHLVTPEGEATMKMVYLR